MVGLRCGMFSKHSYIIFQGAREESMDDDFDDRQQEMVSDVGSYDSMNDDRQTVSSLIGLYNLKTSVINPLRTIFNLFFPTLSHGCFQETPFVSAHSLPYHQSLPFVFLDIFTFSGSHVEDER